jgi:hypothetical protein
MRGTRFFLLPVGPRGVKRAEVHGSLRVFACLEFYSCRMPANVGTVSLPPYMLIFQHVAVLCSDCALH